MPQLQQKEDRSPHLECDLEAAASGKVHQETSTRTTTATTRRTTFTMTENNNATDNNLSNGPSASSSDPSALSSPETILARLTLSEKLKLVSGASLWKLADLLSPHGLPQLTVADGPHGVRKPVTELNLHESHPATCFPTAAALACSWNPALLNRVGQALAKECLHYNIQLLLGPGLNLKRHPAGGRNFEYFSEDPYLSAQLAAAYIAGVQHTGQVGATAKHFAVNNQESHRFVVNAVVDERTARELYLRHFEHLIVTTNTEKEEEEEKSASVLPPAAIMCSYNKVNGVYCSEHAPLMTDILRREWNYSGIVMTDWGATNDRSEGIRAGIDLEMPGSHGVHRVDIEKALETGALSMTNDLNAACLRMIKLIQTYATSAEPTDEQAAEKHPVDWKAHYELAYQVAMECVVLLRNENSFLPIKPQTSVALIGDFARDHPRYQGMGSSQVCSQKVVTAYDEVKRHTDTIFFAPGYHADDDHPELVNQKLVDEAVEMAKKAQAVILCIGLPEIMESEGFDREHLSLPAQHKALVEAVSQVNSQVVVVLSNGGAVEIPWFDKVQAIMEGYLLGEAGGAAVVDLIFGMQSPSGKLAETFPERVEDIPADQYFPGSQLTVEYREGLDVGYRYFDTAQKPVRYPFGHGLSYCCFKYDDLRIDLVGDDPNQVLVNVQFRLTNSSTMQGKEIVQCYVHDEESSVYRPVHELKSFCKVDLQPGESQDVMLQLTQDAFSFYDIGANGWVIENGVFEIRIGSSSRDIRLKGRLALEHGVEKASEMAMITYPAIQDSSNVCPLDDLSFSKRFGYSTAFPLELDDKNDDTDGGMRDARMLALFHRNSLLKEIANKRIIGRLLMSIVYRAASCDIAKGPKRKRQKRMVRAAVENLPLRTIVLFSKGNMTFDVLDGLISIMNWCFIAAATSFGRAFLRMFRRKD